MLKLEAVLTYMDDYLKIVKDNQAADEERAQLYPIILSEYNPVWPEMFSEEKANLERLIGV